MKTKSGKATKYLLKLGKKHGPQYVEVILSAFKAANNDVLAEKAKKAQNSK